MATDETDADAPAFDVHKAIATVAFALAAVALLAFVVQNDTNTAALLYGVAKALKYGDGVLK